MIIVLELFVRAQVALRSRRDESGFTTMELMGNAALGIVSLVVIWAAMQKLGLDLIGFMQDQITSAK